MSSEGDIVLAVDAMSLSVKQPKKTLRDLVAADRPYSGSYLDDTPVHLKAMSESIPAGEVSGEWIGLARFSPQGSVWLREEIDRIEAEGLLETADLPLLLTRLAARHPVAVQYFTAHWLDVDTLSDLADARNFT
jgi:phosphoenolpyruvate phosphomutase